MIESTRLSESWVEMRCVNVYFNTESVEEQHQGEAESQSIQNDRVHPQSISDG